jgi:hypothetical protein
LADNEEGGIDLPEDLVGNLSEAVRKAELLERHLSQVSGVSSQLSDIIAVVVTNSTKLDKNFNNIDSFLKKNVKNAKMFKTLQEETTKQVKKMVEEGFSQKRLKVHKDILDVMSLYQHKIITLEEKEREIGLLQKHRLDLLRDEPEVLKESLRLSTGQLDLLKEHKKAQEKIAWAVANAASAMDKMGAAIRHPAQAVDGMLSSISELPNKIKDATAEGKSFGAVFAAFAKGGLISLGMLAVLGPIILVWKAFKNLYDFIDKNIMPSNAAFNKQLGATSVGAKELKGQINSMGTEFYNMELDFAQGAGAARDFVTALNTTDKVSNATIRTGVELSEILGIGGEQAGKLALQFQKAGESTSDLNEMMSVGEKEAKRWRLPVNKVLKDMVTAPEVMLRFGLANKKAFAESSARAQSYGLSIKEVNQAFGKAMDTFDNTAIASAKLNAIFGTNINSMKLMMETDPTKRMEMLREQLENQGKSWNELNTFEKNVITSTMGVNEEQAALILSDEKTRKQLEAKAKQQKENIKQDEKWNKGLRSLQATLLPVGRLVDKIMRSISDAAGILLNFKSGTDAVTATADLFGRALTWVNDKVQEFIKWMGTEKGKKAVAGFQEAISKLGDKLESVFKWFSEQDLLKAVDAFEGIASAIATIGHKIKWVISPIDTLFEHLSSVDGVAEMLKTLAMSLADPTGLIGAGINKVTGAQDALITKDGRFIKFDPGDNIMASKSAPSVSATGAAIGAGQSPSGQSSPDVIQVNLYLDSKKIQEQMVKLSRY